MAVGKVILVGAGPGDPGLLTVRGHEAIQHADVILYDALSSPELLDTARPDCERIFVGKRSGHHAMPQDRIHGLLVKLAKAGKSVVRLKGGDPYLYGRGGEEALACRAADIPVEVVPGVTSALAVPAYAGIPVLQRGVAGTVLILHGRLRAKAHAGSEGETIVASPAGAQTPEAAPARGGVVKKKRTKPAKDDEIKLRASTGFQVRVATPVDPAVAPLEAAAHDDDTGGADDSTGVLDIDWQAVCRAADTLVFLMFMGSLDEIRAGLLEGGRAASEPVACIQWGTTNRQKTVVSNVDEFPAAIRREKLTAPAVLVVGDVVNLRRELNMFEERPLFGWQVAVTESARDGAEVGAALHAAGATALFARLQAAVPLAEGESEVGALRESFATATHLLFLRAAAVEPFFDSFAASGFAMSVFPAKVKILGVGEETVAALKKLGHKGTLVQASLKSRSLRESFDGGKYDKSSPVVVEAESEWGELADELESAGARVTNLPVRGVQPDEGEVWRLRDAIERGNLNAVLVTSIAAARTLVGQWDAATIKSLLGRVIVGARGDDVASLLAKHKVAVHVASNEGRLADMVHGLVNHRENRNLL